MSYCDVISTHRVKKNSQCWTLNNLLSNGLDAKPVYKVTLHLLSAARKLLLCQKACLKPKEPDGPIFYSTVL